jgi:uncharacterized 2Fe-2S/4Fe-4S cluster protein (DUF4445 family)
MSIKYNIYLLPHGRKIYSESGKTLIEILIDKNIFLRSDCSGKGICGKCRIKKK